MRLAFIRAAGFRGIRDGLEIRVPAGFAVITGRNGSGKSTLCDALEFALTGTLERYASAKEDKESINDYLWWRGEGKPADRYVEIGFLDADGGEFTLNRSPEGVKARPSEKEFFAALSTADWFSKDPRGQATNLTRTTILRDETITGFALDTTEPQRFIFTKSALGITEFTELEKKAQDTVKVLKRRLESAESEYRTTRTRINDLIASSSQLKVQVSQTEDITNAERKLRSLISDPGIEFPLLAATARSELSTLRVEIEGGIGIMRELRDIERDNASVETPEHRAEQERLEERIRQIEREAASLADEIGVLEQQLQGIRREEPRLSNLAQLSEFGSRVGLEDERCPLCGSHIREDSFREHIAQTRSSIEEHSITLNQLVANLAELRQRQAAVTISLTDLRSELRSLSSLKETIRHRSEEMRSALVAFHFDAEKLPVSNQLEEQIAKKRQLASDIEKALAVVETSRMLERLTSVERQVQVAQQHGDSAEKRLRALRTVLSSAQNLAIEINRLSGEIVDEQLAALSPLLSELFLRLRPHLNWLEVDYHLRGDVRHFLSFRVGDDLNPRFLFSSGQRRAAGLAFLFAVHLSRSWCRLKTLMLDDPVQHIDDYRALHLVEVLSAIRSHGQQVICTVEDQALADLLCRRLRSAEDGAGLLVEMEYLLDEGVTIARQTPMYSLPEEVLLPAKVG
jgi:chromosome segregation protein